MKQTSLIDYTPLYRLKISLPDTLQYGVLLENETCIDKLNCRNGGTPKDDHGTCFCECPPEFSGPDCSKGNTHGVTTKHASEKKFPVLCHHKT